MWSCMGVPLVLKVMVFCQVGPGHPRAVNKKHEGWGGEDAYFTVATQYAPTPCLSWCNRTAVGSPSWT